MDGRQLRWGVIGTANIGRVAVLPAIQASANGKLVAVASRDRERASAFATRLGIPQAYGSYEALLAAADVDAVYIPLPNTLHREWAIRAAEAGKHILCEKPLAMDAQQCAEMSAAAQEHGVMLMEAFMYRFHPRMERLRELLAAGVIGEPLMMHSTFSFPVPDRANIRWQSELGGGSLMDVGCYCVNASRTFAGAEPVEVQAYVRWTDTGVDSQMVGTLRFADGLLAQFDSALDLERRESLQIAGTLGHLDVPDAFLPGTADAGIYERHGRREETVHTVSGVDEYRLMVEHFADCVLHDRPLRYPPEEAAANMRAIEALYRSARNAGRPETV